MNEPTTIPTRDALDDKANHLFAGNVLRNDLVRKVKVWQHSRYARSGSMCRVTRGQVTSSRRPIYVAPDFGRAPECREAASAFRPGVLKDRTVR